VQNEGKREIVYRGGGQLASREREAVSYVSFRSSVTKYTEMVVQPPIGCAKEINAVPGWCRDRDEDE